MPKKVALFHTSSATLDLMNKLLAKKCPDIDVLHIIEESMIKDVMKNGGITPDINNRIANYIKAAESANCDIFMTVCSSIGKAVEQCQHMTNMTLARIDTAMIEKALALGKHISVLATVSTTLDPTVEYIKRMCEEKDCDIQIEPHLIAGAFEALLAGDFEKHDRLVVSLLNQLVSNSDVIILAQASMARAISEDLSINIPVLTSPELGISWLAEIAKA